MSKLQIGLHGTNGHQIAGKLVDHPRAQLAAVSAFDASRLPEALRQDERIRRYETLDDLLQDDGVELVSLCAPRRADQAAEAIRALQAGKHVYAEKPCAMSEADLDGIIAAAAQSGRIFHEMSGTVFEQPYYAMRELVHSGALGTVIQVLAQKSYPMHDGRPQDEDVDGGLTMQNGVHAMRFVEHITGIKVAAVQAVETQLGNPKPGELRVAAAMLLRLENGGVASIIANYLNPPAFGSWGNEHVRIFGTKGFLESTDGGTKTRLVLQDEDCGPIDTAAQLPDYFDRVVDEILDGTPMPLCLEDELHPTRMVIRARSSARD